MEIKKVSECIQGDIVKIEDITCKISCIKRVSSQSSEKERDDMCIIYGKSELGMEYSTGIIPCRRKVEVFPQSYYIFQWICYKCGELVDDERVSVCHRCDMGFCLYCSQHSGNITEDDEYTCELCLYARHV